MAGPLGPASVLAAGFPPTGTGTPVNIGSVIVISIIFVSCDLSLTADIRVHGVSVPCLAG